MNTLFAAGYQHLLKPILFLFDAEDMHNFFTSVGIWLGNFSITKKTISQLFSYRDKKLEKTIDGISFPNPVGLAAGFDYNANLQHILPDLSFGWHTIGTVTYQPYKGNKKPRLGRYPKSQALLVNKGLKSLGTKQIISKLQLQSKQATDGKVFSIPTAISIASTNTHFDNTKQQLIDILLSFNAFEKSGLNHSLYEMNVSCPNTFGGEPFTSPERLEILLSCLDKLKLSKPVYLKMPIDQGEKITLQLLKVADKHQIQGVILGNLTKDKNNPDVDPTDTQDWQNRKGNLSGKPTFARSLQLIKLTKKNFGNRFTIVGTGGIFSGEDALKKIEAGADLIQLITGMIYQGPQLIGEINQFLASSHRSFNNSTN